MSDSKPIEKMDAVSGISVSTATLAKMFGVTTKTIQNLTNDGVLEKRGRGSYQIAKSVLAYCTYLRSKTGASDDAKSIELQKAEEDMKLKKAKREKAELEIEVKKGTLVEAKEAKQIYGNLVQTFRAKMLMLPVKVAPSIVGVKDIKVVQNKIEDEVHKALAELSNLKTSNLGGEKDETS